MTDPTQPSDHPGYPGGFDAILTQMEGRRDPLSFAPGEALAPLDVDLAPLKLRLVDGRAPAFATSTSGFGRKMRDLSREFDGQPELLLLHGLLIANLRRRAQPAQTAPLFLRLWTEEPDWLLDNLDPRWLVSAITTFGDHGATATQRRIGQTLGMLFGLMKLYETERLYSGSAPDAPFPWAKQPAQTLALQMDPYALGGGGLDVNMLGRLWQDADDDPLIRPLAQYLLRLMIEDPRTVFHRLRRMRRQRARSNKASGIRPKRGPAARPMPIPVPEACIKTDPAQIRWGTVSLIKAPLRDIARFAAFHLDLGAHKLHLHLDEPMPAATALFAQHPRIEVTTCDAAWWAAQKKPRMRTHQLRQAWIATQTYQRTDLDWLAHIDVDEFILTPRPLREALAMMPADAAALHLPPAELLGDSTAHFKLTPRDAGHARGVLEEIYPNFGAYLRGGFISHLEGKLIARCGIPGLRFGLHALLQNGQPASNRPSLPEIYLGHAHAPDFDHFRRHLEFRMQKGSYRKTDDSALQLQDILEMLRAEDGEDGLRAFYSEVCAATPDLLGKLGAHDMLLRHDLDLDDRVARHFGPLGDA